MQREVHVEKKQDKYFFYKHCMCKEHIRICKQEEKKKFIKEKEQESIIDGET